MSRNFFGDLNAKLKAEQAAKIERLKKGVAEVVARDAVKPPDIERHTCPCGAWKVKCVSCGEWWCRAPGHMLHVCRAPEFSQVTP